MPWILLAIENLYCRLTWRWVALGAAFVALQLFAGEPQMNLYTILVCGGYFLFSFYRREERRSDEGSCSAWRRCLFVGR